MVLCPCSSANDSMCAPSSYCGAVDKPTNIGRTGTSAVRRRIAHVTVAVMESGDDLDGALCSSALPGIGRRSVARRSLAWRGLLLLSIGLSTSLFASPSHAGRSLDFEFHDDEYLHPGQHAGGRAYIPTKVNADEPVPLVVFLHGVNRQNQLHMWLGPGPDDLRVRLETSIKRGDLPPAVLAAPSQTRFALWANTLWTGFDLDEFVSAAQRAVAGRARISRDQVIVAGHSGAGCNVEGGLLKIAADRGAVLPMGIVALDTCLDAGVGEALARASEFTRIGAYWQSHVWNRRVADFAIGFEVARPAALPGTDWFAHVDPVGRWPHDALVAPSLLEAISVLIGPSESSDAVAAKATVAEYVYLAE